MDKAQAKMAAARLAAWFPRYPLGAVTIQNWAEEFEQHPPEIVEGAVFRLRGTKDRNDEPAPPQGDEVPEALRVEYELRHFPDYVREVEMRAQGELTS